MTPILPIGGFLDLEIQPCEKEKKNILNFWGVNKHNAFMFHNARSALHYLLDYLHLQKLWLPSYICKEMAVMTQDHVLLEYYPIQDNLSPNLEFLADNISPNDAVLAVDYFGCLPEKKFLTFVQQRSDIIWIEDRAQALYPAIEPWGNWVLYSPRKLLGVPDGGILVNPHHTVHQPTYEEVSSTAFMLPTLSRFEDIQSHYNQEWYADYVKNEKQMGISLQKMSRFSLTLLSNLDPSSIIESRKNNYNILYDALKEISFLQIPAIDFVPLGFPIQVKNRDEIAVKLYQEKIYPAKHWQHLPSDPLKFQNAHKLSRKILTLPCDQRYGPKEMDRIITTLRSIV